MHKFFCNYNHITEKFELSANKGNFFNNKVNVQEENLMMKEIKNYIQNLYELIVQIKEMEKDENNISLLEETELMISNLYYSFFASPLELAPKEQEAADIKILLTKAIEEANNLEKIINIPEYNRLAMMIRNNFQVLLNKNAWFLDNSIIFKIISPFESVVIVWYWSEML